MFHTLYMISVLVTNPTTSADIKALGDSQYKVREAAAKRLESLPGWTALYIKNHSRKAKDPEVRSRCARVYEKLDLKWKADLLKWKADVILALFPTIPANVKAMGDRRSFKVREEATKRLESLPGFVAPYFKYYAEKTTDPVERDRCERMYEKLDRKWRSDLGGLYEGFQWEIHKIKAEKMRQKLRATVIANLAKLSAEDLKLAVAQGLCPIRDDLPLGGQGVPVKIILKGQPVLLCCKDCIEKAKADPDKTLAKAKKTMYPLRRLLTKELLQKLEQPSDSSNNRK